jgi:hypothetical protein
MKKWVRGLLAAISVLGGIALGVLISHILRSIFPQDLVFITIGWITSLICGYAGGSIAAYFILAPRPFISLVYKLGLVRSHNHHEELPQVTGSIYAVRGWDVRSTWFRTRLHGVVKPWKRGEIKAKCKFFHESNRSPGFGCRCGIYAYKDARSWEMGDYSYMPIWGIVELSGKAIEHTRGYRAEKAKVVAVYFKNGCPEALDFNVPIFTDFRHMCQEFGLETDEREV